MADVVLVDQTDSAHILAPSNPRSGYTSEG